MSPDEDFSATSALVVTSVQEAGESQQTSDNVDLVAQYLLSRVDVVLNNMSMVDEEVSESVALWIHFYKFNKCHSLWRMW